MIHPRGSRPRASRHGACCKRQKRTARTACSVAFRRCSRGAALGVLGCVSRVHCKVFDQNGQNSNRRTTGKRTPRTETAKPTAGEPRPAHTHRTTGAVHLGGVRAGSRLRSAAGLPEGGFLAIPGSRWMGGGLTLSTHHGRESGAPRNEVASSPLHHIGNRVSRDAGD